MMDNSSPTFEEGLAQLKQLAGELDSPDMPLAEFVQKFQQAEAIAASCRDRLEQAKQALPSPLRS